MKGSITCKQAVDYVSKQEEGRLSGWQRVKLWRHLAVCSLCRRFSAQNKMISKLLSGHSHEHEHKLSESDKRQIADRVLGNEGTTSK